MAQETKTFKVSYSYHTADGHGTQDEEITLAEETDRKFMVYETIDGNLGENWDWIKSARSKWWSEATSDYLENADCFMLRVDKIEEVI